MQLLNQVIIKRPHAQDALIQLLQGDLTALPKEHAADILIVSAYPGSYIPVPNTLIANLYNKGIDVAALAKHKAIDLRDQLGCWLSETLSEAQQAQFNFKKILCFEPWLQTNEQVSVVGNIFRCINTFAFNENNNVIAMPVLSSGKQKVPFEKMLPAMMDASIFWLESGLPVICMKLVLFSDEQSKVALPIFTRAVQQYQLKKSVRDGSISGIDALKKFDEQKQQQLPGEESLQIIGSEIKEMAQKEQDEKKLIANPVAPAKPPSVEPPVPSRSAAPYPAAAATISENKAVNDAKINSPAPGAITADAQYDYFISYAHKHAAIVDLFVNNLTIANKNLQVFYDKSSIPPGGLWIKQISDAIQKAKKVLIFLSPEYSNSPVCWDEFQCAKLMEYNSKKQLIQSIYLYNDAALPPIMGIYSWVDCREGDKDKLQQMAEQLVSELSGQ